MNATDMFFNLADMVLLLGQFLPIADLLNTCQVSKRFSSILDTESNWKNRLNIDFPDFGECKGVLLTWKEKYMGNSYIRFNLKAASRTFKVSLFEPLAEIVCFKNVKTLKQKV